MKELSNAELNKLKKIVFNMMVEVDDLCNEHEISYSLAAGSLLGAVRHKGFIPWDDDIDIMLKRDQYDKLRDCVNQLDGDIYWVDYLTDNGYPYPFAKIMKRNTVLREESNKYASAPDGVFLDVFPIDFTSDSFRERNRQYLKVTRWKQRLVTRENYYFGQVGLRECYRRARKAIFNLLPKSYFVNKMEIESKIFPPSNTLISLGGTTETKKATYDKNWFDNYIRLEFEGRSLMVIQGYEELLKRKYGDYMKLPSKKNRIPHHYINKLEM